MEHMCKNDGCHCQQILRKPLHPLKVHPEGIHLNSVFENMKASLATVCLLVTGISGSTSVEYCKVSQGPNGMH